MDFFFFFVQIKLFEIEVRLNENYLEKKSYITFKIKIKTSYTNLKIKIKTNLHV